MRRVGEQVRKDCAGYRERIERPAPERHLGLHLAVRRGGKIKMGQIRKEVPLSAAGTPVAHVMTARPITIRPDMRLDEARDLLLRKGLSRVPVVDELGRAVGMLSMTNLVATGQGRRLDSPPHQQQKIVGHPQAQDVRVAEVMKCHVLAVPESASLAQAAQLLVSHGLHGAPVTSPAGVVVGFVSSSDVLAWLAGLR